MNFFVLFIYPYFLQNDNNIKKYINKQRVDKDKGKKIVTNNSCADALTGTSYYSQLKIKTDTNKFRGGIDPLAIF